MSVRITSVFDSGAIELVGTEGDSIDVRIRRDDTSDADCDFRQWFHFRIQGAAKRRLTVRFINAGSCTYPGGWPGYRVCASIDTENWFRIDTSYDGVTMTAVVEVEHDSIWLAYFEPYPWQRHLALLGRGLQVRDAQSLDLGLTLDGRDFNGLAVGNPSGIPAWIIARQHPGETMAEWFVEDLIERLLDRSDALTRSVLDRVRLYIVPNMNPDGSVRGNLRANAAGTNLNREWMAPSAQRSPEVLAVRDRMLATGCEFFLDVHGDEALPYVFVAGSEMLPSYTERQGRLQAQFCEHFKLASPDFQTEYGYDSGKYSQEALKLASKWAGHTFGCLSLTLEMPFKDNADWPDGTVGWNGARSKALGRAALVPIAAVLNR